MNKKLYNDFNNKYFSSNNNINNNDNYNNYINKTNHSKNHYLNKNLNYNNKYINNYSYNNPNLKAKKRLDKKDEIKLNSEKNEIKEINKNIDINNYNDNFIKEDEVYKNFLRLYNIVKTPIESLFLLDNYNELTFELKKKLLEIFQITEMKEEYFYRKILQLIDENGHKICLKLLNIIIFFIEKKIIPINNNENIKVNAFEYFLNNSRKIMNEGLYEKYIFIFQIKEKLIKHFEIKENLFKLKRNSIYLIKFLNLQDKFSFKEYDLIINEKKSIDYSLVNHLFHTYNRSEEELLNLYKYIISKIKKNSIPSTELKSIFNNNNFKEDFKKLLINNLLKYPEEMTDKEYLSFYGFIFKNNLESYFPETKEPNKFLDNIVFNLKFYETALRILNYLPKEKIKSLNKLLLKELLYSIDPFDINSITFLLKYIPEEFDGIINRYNFNTNKKVIKKLINKFNIKEKTDNAMIKKIEESNIVGFFIYKVKTYFVDHLDILIEHVTNQREFEVFFKIILRTIKSMKLDSINKLSYIINYGKNKGFILPEIKKRKQKELMELAQKKNNIIYIPKDKFGPKTEDCLSYSKNEINVIVIKTCKELIENYQPYFEKTKYIGIDTEWRDSLHLHIKTKTAIMQLSDYAGKNVLIIDMLEIIKEDNFFNYLKIYSKEKLLFLLDLLMI